MLSPEFILSCQMEAERSYILAMGRREPCREVHGPNDVRWHGEDGGWFPMWARDYSSAFKLLCKHNMIVNITDEVVTVDGEGFTTHHFPTKELAVCYAIVKMATRRLT